MTPFGDIIARKFSSICRSYGIEDILHMYINHIVPEDIDRMITDSESELYRSGISQNMIQRECIYSMGFNLINKKSAYDLSNFIGEDKVLEIMGGLGSLTYALEENDVDIICTDNYEFYGDNADTWTNVENLDAIEAIEKYGKDIKYILVSWPDNSDVIINALLTMRRINPECTMIYIGEGYDGYCAPREFFDIAKDVSDDYDYLPEIDKWDNSTEAIYLFK